MASTTPKLGLPYPVGTDRLMDGDNAIQSLAETLETRFGDPPAMSIYLNGNASPASGYIQLSVLVQGWKVGNIAAGSNVITIAVPGIYVVMGVISWGSGSGTIGRRGIQIRKGGAAPLVLVTNLQYALQGGASGQVSSAHAIAPLAAGDTLALYSYHDSATNQPTAGGTDQSLTFLHAACLART